MWDYMKDFSFGLMTTIPLATCSTLQFALVFTFVQKTLCGNDFFMERREKTTELRGKYKILAIH